MQQLQLPIRNAGLYSALRAYVIAGLELLREDHAGGAEIEFSVAEHKRGPRKPFFEYRPLVERFVSERLERIRELPVSDEAAWALASDPACSAWLRAGRADAIVEFEQVARDELLEPLLMTMAEADPTFEFDESRLMGRYLDLERTIYAEQRRYVAVVPLWGVRLVYGDLQLAEGVALRQVDQELFRSEWPEAAQLNWGSDARNGLPGAVIQFERAVSDTDGIAALDPRDAIVQVVAAIRALAGGTVHAGPFILERFDFSSLAPRPVPAIAGRRIGEMPSKIDGTVASALPIAVRRLSSDPNGSVARALERYQLAMTLPGIAALRALVDAIVDVYSREREAGLAGLRLAAVVGGSLPERHEFVNAMQEALRLIAADTPPDGNRVIQLTATLSLALRATIAAALVGELPITALAGYADAILLGDRERKRLGVSAMQPEL